MRALQIAELDGPDALSVVEMPEPAANHFLTPDEGVLIDVKPMNGVTPDWKKGTVFVQGGASNQPASNDPHPQPPSAGPDTH